MTLNFSKNNKAYIWPIALFIILSAVIGFGLNTHTDEFILFNDLAFKHPNFILNNFTLYNLQNHLENHLNLINLKESLLNSKF